MTSRPPPTRRLIVSAATAALLLPRVSRAQEPRRVYRIAGLTPNPRDFGAFAFFFDGLRRLGFIEGQNLTIDPRGFGLRPEQFREVAAELVKDKLDVIVTAGEPATRAAQQATATIPILGSADDMLGSGLVGSMARPGGNTTGVSLLASELDSKRLELLIEIVPGARHVAALADPKTAAPSHSEALQRAARARGIELSIYWIGERKEIIGVIDMATQAGAQALTVLASPLLDGRRQLIIERAAALHLPTMYQWPDTAGEGGLAGYGARKDQIFGDVWARQLVRLLQGAKPTDLPIEQPTKFALAINLKTAKELGLTVPQSILARADEVIE
jgi:putative tryptophan/tyrosine transport system substrate-binding protein